MRLVLAECSVNYVGRLTAHLARAPRLLMVKADGSVLVHSDGGSYKPLNWMAPPCSLTIEAAEAEDALETWKVTHKKTGDSLEITVFEIIEEMSRDLGIDPGLEKAGVEAHLQALLAENMASIGEGWKLVRREYPTAIGPVDILAKNPEGGTVAIEIKRRGEIDGVEQLTRYVELLNRDPLLAPVTGMFAAQEIKPQARTLAKDRGFECLTLDYDELRGIDNSEMRLF
ncbi:endonuclease NucS [Dermabacter hominis]|uniref:endonuclease NucS n=1 Tax=Dermabacter hominis TaxID=36740 RepID=UPI0021AF2732|nr:endonuclease NucS [Dermabacter hominis]MCT2026367.1 endonuclease NucS [Dermabacter hominis]